MMAKITGPSGKVMAKIILYSINQAIGSRQ